TFNNENPNVERGQAYNHSYGIGRDGVANGSIYFAANGGFYMYPRALNPLDMQSVTIAFWYKSVASKQPVTRILNIQDSTANDASVLLVTKRKDAQQQTNLEFKIGLSAVSNITITIPIDAVWNHFALSYSVTDKKVTLYKNGKPVDTKQAICQLDMQIVSLLSLQLDAQGNPTTDTDPSLVDDLFIYDRAITPAEALALGGSGGTNDVTETTHNTMQIYPNPASTYATLSVPTDAQPDVLIIRTITGAEVLRTTYTQHIDVQQLPAGVYTVELYSNLVILNRSLLQLVR
ncbi:MAG: T9SS type A sorting domain-containing protein, partial [Candidatus Kapabacteria bacterium]|nr:T9SS type A sorting domain-containing protein [Candidatus Kapabacteria bacterium]